MFFKLTLFNGAAVALLSKAADLWAFFAVFLPGTLRLLHLILSLAKSPSDGRFYVDIVAGSPRTIGL
jgi:hypothetical protein